MKSILLSIRPEWVAKILNGDKTIEIRKKFPKDYRGWVYIYCTKGKDLFPKYAYDYKTQKNKTEPSFYDLEKLDKENKHFAINGKVVARFWCDKVLPNTYTNCLVGSCLTYEQIKEYIKGKDFVGIHISKLNIFERPQELKDFNIKKAPQNYMYIEGE